jgi:hypothetical protein
MGKNQHYIARCILEKFANSKKQVFEKLVDSKKEPFITKYSQAMTTNYTYEHPYLDENALENHFDKNYENDFAIVLNEIIKRLEESDEDRNITDVKRLIEEHIEKIIVFYYRSGALLYEFEFQRRIREDKILLMLENIMNSRYLMHRNTMNTDLPHLFMQEAMDNNR